MYFLLIQYHQAVCLASGVGKSSLIDRVSRVEKATGRRRHVILYSEIGASLTWLAVHEAVRTLETGEADIQKHGKKS